jgi:hypothetical protein
MNKKQLILIFLFIFSVHFVKISRSQTDPLGKRISISIQNQTLEKTLNILSSKANIFFSYNSDIIPLDSMVSVSFERKEVYKILNQLLGNKFYYKTSGQHVIILKKKANQSPKKDKLELKGSIIEFGTGLKVVNASILHVNGKEGTLSDENGRFSFTIMPKGEYAGLVINKSGYKDTVILVKIADLRGLEIELKPELLAISSIKPVIDYQKQMPNVEQSSFVPRFVRKDMILHAKNIAYLKQKLGQISFLPYAGTNYKFSGSIVNNVSLNVLAGYSYGTKGVEVGGLLNINRKKLNGIQVAGFGNITGDKTNGIQLAGFFNHSYGKVNGVQIAGFNNSITDTLNGVQISGFSNILKGKIRGSQISGFANITTDEVEALQYAGFVNIALKSSTGIQAAGFANIANGDQGWVQASGFANFTRGSMRGVQSSGFLNVVGKDANGVQAAGFLNFAKDSVKGIQAAGFMNIAGKDVKGVQLAGFLNYARKVKGVQVGVINIADTVLGVSIGIFNFIRKGLHQISIGTNERLGADFKFSLGTYRFYTIFGIEANLFSDSIKWAPTFGFGTHLFGSRRLSLNIDLTETVLSKFRVRDLSMAQHFKLGCDLNLRVTKHFLVYTGLSYNLLSYNPNQIELGNYTSNYLFPVSFNKTFNNVIFKGWAGASVGLKFRF